jgi:hypothetical protein
MAPDPSRSLRLRRLLFRKSVTIYPRSAPATIAADWMKFSVTLWTWWISQFGVSKNTCARRDKKKHIIFFFCHAKYLHEFAFKLFCVFNICLILSRRAQVFFETPNWLIVQRWLSQTNSKAKWCLTWPMQREEQGKQEVLSALTDHSVLINGLGHEVSSQKVQRTNERLLW